MSSGVVKFLEERGVQVRWARGGWQPCKCPFHEDRSASASVNTSTERFHCFVCNVNEDLIGLIRHVEPGVGYVEAKQKAEAEYGQGSDVVAGSSARSGRVSHEPWNQHGDRSKVQSWRSLL